MRVTARHEGLKVLEDDLKSAGPRMVHEAREIIEDNVKAGAFEAKRLAKLTARRHGKHYPASITYDRTAAVFMGFDGGEIKGAYGPDTSLPQGGMSFEDGSRNQPPHHDLANSLDLIRPKFERDVDNMLGRALHPDGDR